MDPDQRGERLRDDRDGPRGRRGCRRLYGALADDRTGDRGVRTLATVSVGDELPELARVVSREDVKAYADAGGDQNPLHQDDAFARSLGFPGIIAHGMFTMGHMASAIVAWAGDSAAVVALSAQFRAPVFIGETIVAGGVERDGSTEWPVKKGEARVRLASGSREATRSRAAPWTSP
ncbi:MAG: dehydratase [Actinobacteria bacterium]|nr:MAG: dehydratase [Actinomycetota bacterium]